MKLDSETIQVVQSFRDEIKSLETEIETYKKIINDTLRALPVGNINTHTPDTIPERVQDWVKEAAEECSLREKWEACADNLIHYAKDYVRYLEDMSSGSYEECQKVSDAITQYEKLKELTDA